MSCEHAKCPLVYNGNIFSKNDYEYLKKTFNTDLDPIMAGRGLITDPSLADKLKGNTDKTDIAKLKLLHDTLYREYKKVMSPDINVLYKMRELWNSWQVQFDGKDRDIKRLMKAKKCTEYEESVERIFS